MRIAAVVGRSNSGKTTLMTALIRHFVTEGQTVGAIKHTHHQLNEDRRGDTAKLGEAGADPVILAGDGEAVLFSRHAVERLGYASPAELLARFDTDLVFIEGFKNAGHWPRIELDSNSAIQLEEALAILDTIWRT